LNSIISVYPTSKEIGNGFISAINDALEKFTAYENLMIMMKRYRDIIITKLPNLPFETNEPEKKIVEGTPATKPITSSSNNRERKRSKHRERGRSKEDKEKEIKKYK